MGRRTFKICYHKIIIFYVPKGKKCSNRHPVWYNSYLMYLLRHDITETCYDKYISTLEHELGTNSKYF